jgi:muramidase (phage lysozyme)
MSASAPPGPFGTDSHPGPLRRGSGSPRRHAAAERGGHSPPSQPGKTQHHQSLRREDEISLFTPNVRAFIEAVAWAEGGQYDLKFGRVKGRKNDPWRFSDFSTHPGVGKGGSITAAGMYQINESTWREAGGNIGLHDFSPGTQDLLAVEILRGLNVIPAIQSGDVPTALSAASKRWAALPQGPGLGNRYPPQPFKTYEAFLARYKHNGGTTP